MAHPGVKRFDTWWQNLHPSRSAIMHRIWAKNKWPLQNQQFINPSDHRRILKRLTALQYTMFMVAALAVLVAVPSSHAATLHVDSSCPDDDNNGTCNDRTRFKNPDAAITNATSGDVIVIADGTYLKPGSDYYAIGKSLTLKSTNGNHAQDDVIFSGTGIQITANNVRIQGMEIVDAPVHGIHVSGPRSDIAVENNYVNNTQKQGITGAGSSGNTIKVSVTGNTFEHIGYNAPDGKKPLFANGDKASQHDMTAIYFDWLADSEISGNIIDKTTWSGINLGRVTGLTISGNTISDVPKNGIQIAYRESVNNTISGNTITNATFADSKHRGGALIADNLKGAISLSSSLDTVVENNVIRDSRHGVILCDGDCHATTFEPDTSSYSGKPTAKITKNTFDNVRGFDIINAVVNYVLPAPLNYYGDSPDFAAALSGPVQYSPYYADYVGGELRAMGPAKQQSLADVQRTDICSIGLEKYNLYFDDAAWGTESSAEANAVLNTGDIVLTGVKIQTDGWLDEKDNLVVGAKTTVADRLVGNFLDLLSTNPDGIDMNANLPAPDTDEKLDLQFTLDLTGKATGPDSQIREIISFAGSCS